MEVIGLCFSVPVALVASVIFCVLIRVVIESHPLVRRICIFASVVLLLSTAAELALTCTLGAGRFHDRIGDGRYRLMRAAHFFLAAPSVGTLVLARAVRRDESSTGGVIAAVACCWVAAVASVFYNVFVDEAVYGVDGSGVRAH